MRAVIQRVSQAKLEIDGQIHSAIHKGLVILLGIEGDDDASDAEWLVNKIRQMRIFSDAEGKMNLSVEDIDGQLLVVSQFTLHASTKKGNRPSFIRAAPPEKAIPLYEHFIDEAGKTLDCKTGVFGAEMHINLTNDGPVTIIIDSRNKE